MANYNNIKATIDGNIFENGSELITGSILNDVLKQMVDAFAVGYQYKGVATPSLNPGSPDARVFYLTTTPGTYTRFGGLTVGSGELALLRWDSSWHKDSFSVGGGGGGGDVTVIDNLNSTSATAALSANQGGVLKDRIDSRVLVVDASEKISDHVSDVKDLGIYPHINVAGVGDILPIYESTVGWLYEYQEGWRISGDIANFDINKTFDELMARLDEISLPIYTKPSSGIPESDLTLALTTKINNKVDKMTVTTANPDDEEVTIQPNEFCVMTDEPYTAFYVIYFLENTDHMESIFKFTTGDDVPTIEWDGITAWLGGEPIINANKTYIVSVLDGLGVIGEF